MSDQDNIYPDLPEGGAEQAQALVERFKKQIASAAEDAISGLYCDLVPYIESDAWANMRNKMMDGLKDYSNAKLRLNYDFRDIRAAMLKEHREEIIADLNADLVRENEQLKSELEIERSRQRY